MRSTSIASPMLTLPHDALSEIALRLPTVKSTKPWRDMNSLATTCMRLYEWKKTTVDNDVEMEWMEVKKKIHGVNGWRNGLEIIISDFENLPTRLFREPMLRRLAGKELASAAGQHFKDIRLFLTRLYSMRETVSITEIHQLFELLNNVSLSSKTKIIAMLSSLLPEFTSSDRQQVLLHMFKVLDEDSQLKYALLTKDTFNTIGNLLGEDHQSKILLLLSLYSRELLSPPTGYSFGLSFILEDDRWPWILKKIPEFLDTEQGMEVMLDDSACRVPMIDYLHRSFLECKSDIERFSLCKRVSAFYPLLCKSSDGEKLIGELVCWFLRSPEFCIGENGRLNNHYIGLLSKNIALYKNFLGKNEKDLLAEKISKAINYAIRVKAYDQSTSLLIEIAKIDKKLITKVCQNSFDLTNKDALMDALLNVNSLKDLAGRYHYVSALCIAAQHHRDSDPKFFKAFLDVRNTILLKM